MWKNVGNRRSDSVFRHQQSCRLTILIVNSVEWIVRKHFRYNITAIQLCIIDVIFQSQQKIAMWTFFKINARFF